MINVLIPIVENVEEFSNFIKQSKSEDVCFFVGIKESLAKDFSVKMKNVEIHKFADGSHKEEIINALQGCKFKKGKIMIVRRPLTKEEFEKLSTSQKDIVTLNARRSGFMTALKNLVKKIISRIFAFSYFEDISAICYGERMFDLLSVCANFSMASRINKYVGVEMEEITTETKPVKKDYSRWKAIMLFIMWSLLMVGSVVGGVLICVFVELKALIVILIICWIIVAVILWLIGIVNFMRTLCVGDLRFGRAQEIV